MSTTTGPAPYCYVIAEIGINHNGDVEIAKKLIDLAAGAGCDAVKFQKRTVEIVYPPEVLDSPRESPWGDTQRDQKEALEFGRDEYDAIDRHARERGIDWFASSWDPPSLEFVESYDPPHHKVASALITNQEMLEAIADVGKHTFISTALSEWDDVDNAVEVFRSRNCPFTLMHCIGTYPMEDEELVIAGLPFCALPVAELDGARLTGSGALYRRLVAEWCEVAGFDVAEQVRRLAGIEVPSPNPSSTG